MRGSTAYRSSQPIAPVVNRHDLAALRLDLNRGNATARPTRLPLRESPQFFNAAASCVKPDA